MLELGHTSRLLDKEKLIATYMTRESSQTPGRQSKVVVCERPLTDDALSLLAWASAKPAVAQVRFNDYHRNFELVTGDPSTVVRAVYSGDVDGKDGEVVVEGRMKYLIHPGAAAVGGDGQ